jgi:hypothetical protein
MTGPWARSYMTESTGLWWTRATRELAQACGVRRTRRYRVLREGVQRLNPPLRPDAAAEVILGAVALVRENCTPPG